MTELEKIVLECISNAYEGGYEAEIRDFTDEQLTWDLMAYAEDDVIQAANEQEILAAVRKVRGNA